MPVNLHSTSSATRAVALVLLGFAALAVTAGLFPGQGLAAPAGQTSPLETVSPLESPTPTATATPTATPTATSPVPPTSEPPAGLAAWPTPTPTPYAEDVQAALSALSADEALAVADPAFSARLLVDDPETGDEVTIVRLTDPATATTYWLQVDSQGAVSFLPDFGAEGVSLVADIRGVDAAALTYSNGFYIPFPFTRQILWLGEFSNSATGSLISIALNLAGEEVDQAEAAAAEAEAIDDYCGAIDVALCAEMLYAPDETETYVALVLEDEADPEPVVDFLNEEEIDFREEEGDYYLRAQNSTLRELAQVEGILTIQQDFPDEVKPLDTNLILGLIERAGVVSLTLQSENLYPLLTYRVEASLARVAVTRTQSVTLLATIDGIFTPASGPGSRAPALGELALGPLSGRYDLRLTYDNADQDVALADNYNLIISDGRAVIRAAESSFTWAMYPTWLRLPGDAIWLVVQALPADAQGEPFDTEREDFLEKVEAFYADVAGLPARELSLAEGVYANDLFVPPWKSWQIPDGDYVRVPLNGDQSFLFRWPDIRYFTYEGVLANLEDLMLEHCVDEVSIVGYTAGGAVLDVCQPR